MEFPLTSRNSWVSDIVGLASKVVNSEFLSSSSDILDESKDFASKSQRSTRSIALDVVSSVGQLETSATKLKARQSKYESEFRAITNKVASSSLTSRTANTQIQSLIREAFTDSFELGFRSNSSSDLQKLPLTKEDRAFLEKSIRAESGYASKLIADILKGQSAGRVNARVKMYANTLDAIYTNGFLSTLPRNTVVWWVLRASESCKDCRSLAAGSPYSLGTPGRRLLPTTPRSGATRCFSNCRCVLKLDLPPEKGGVRKDFYNEPSAIVEGRGSSKVLRQATDLYDQLNVVRQKILLAKSSSELPVLFSERSQLTQELIDLQKSAGVSIKPAFSVKDVEASVEGLKSSGIVDFKSLRRGDRVAWIRGPYGFPATVKSVSSTKVVLVTDYGDIEVSSRDSVLLLK